MRKIIVFLALCSILFTGMASAASWPEWAGQAEVWAEQNNLSETFTENPFQPVTRGQTAQILYEAAGSPVVNTSVTFTDVPEQYVDAVTWAASNGFVQGMGNERYAPNRLVTRQEFALILYRRAGNAKAAHGYAWTGFADASSVSGWARDAMRWCVGDGLIYGKTENRIAPHDPIIVAEAALMLQRADAGNTSGEALAVSSLAEIKVQLSRAMAITEQPPVFDIHVMQDTDNLEIDVRNLYYALLSEQPERKYAYDIQVAHTENGLLYCTFSYMPYCTGSYPTGFDGTSVANLRELIETARANIGTSADTPIRITDRSLLVDDMNLALQQVGGGYILCQLNQDGTKITYTPLNNMAYADCLNRLHTIDRLADLVIEEQVNGSMTDTEKADALYAYLTEHVLYDHRYYSDRSNLPYHSQTAYGALHDNLAICGGYAQALQTLFQKAGISCYTVSGSMGREYHMWNIAYVEEEWRYFDATSDRGRASYWFNFFNVPAEHLTRYNWDTGFIQRFTQAVTSGK